MALRLRTAVDPYPRDGDASPEAPLPISAEEFRQLMSHWPTGVSVVTSRDGALPVGCTVNALMSVCLTPPLLLVSLAQNSRTLSAISDSGRFAVNVLAASQRALCERFARRPHAERFVGLPHHDREGLPVLRDTTAALGCVVRDTVRCGDHELVVGTVLWCTAPATPRPPLLFHRSALHPFTGVPEGCGDD